MTFSELHEAGKDLGVRPAKYIPGGVHKRLLHGLPEELSHGKGQGKRRSPKREYTGDGGGRPNSCT